MYSQCANKNLCAHKNLPESFFDFSKPERQLSGNVDLNNIALGTYRRMSEKTWKDMKKPVLQKTKKTKENYAALTKKPFKVQKLTIELKDKSVPEQCLF